MIYRVHVGRECLDKYSCRVMDHVCLLPVVCDCHGYQTGTTYSGGDSQHAPVHYHLSEAPPGHWQALLCRRLRGRRFLCIIDQQEGSHIGKCLMRKTGIDHFCGWTIISLIVLPFPVLHN